MSKKMYYWIDHTPKFEANSGIQRVARGLARGLEELGTNVVYLQWSAWHQSAVRAPEDQLRKFGRWGGPEFRLQDSTAKPGQSEEIDRSQFWRNWLIVPEVPYCSHRRMDLTRELVDYARRNGLRIAFVFYDLIPLTSAGYEDLRRAHRRYIRALALADLVIPISRYSARQFESYCLGALKLTSSDIPRIAPILLADEFANYPRVEVVSEPPKGTIKILALGMIEPRKNQSKLLKAFNAFCVEHPGLDVQLTLVGRFHAATRYEIQSLARANPKVQLVSDHLPEEVIVDAFSASHFSVFPSVEEGYGLPIAESLWLGKPCLCANFGSMAEIAAGGGCLTADTRSVHDIKQALASLVLDGSFRRKLAEEAVARPLKLWREYAAELLAVLETHTERRTGFDSSDLLGETGSILGRTARIVRLAIGRAASALASRV